MGGLYGNAAATALEDVPEAARGLMSGILQQGVQTWDAFDFFTVSLTVTQLAKEFGKTKTDITWGITLVLMFRSVGSVIFGIAADRYGRKWPFVVNNLLF
ncbi:hypothetical protein BN1708_015326, partial [Verticillium longisporum]